jgi:hypothetical protein
MGVFKPCFADGALSCFWANQSHLPCFNAASFSLFLRLPIHHCCLRKPGKFEKILQQKRA